MLNAIPCGSIEMVILLFKRKCNINYQNTNTVTPLMEATMHDNIKIIRILPEHKPELTIFNNNKEIATFYAIRNDSQEALELLDKKGADHKIP